MKKQANARTCFVCGVENPSGLGMNFYQTPGGEIVANYRVHSRHQGYPGVTHGGIVAAMLDETAGRALMGDENPRFMVTGQLNVRYKKPVPTGVDLRLVGRVKSDKGRMAVAESFIYDVEGTLLAQAEVVLFDVPADIHERFNDPKDWQVYPDSEE